VLEAAVLAQRLRLEPESSRPLERLELLRPPRRAPPDEPPRLEELRDEPLLELPFDLEPLLPLDWLCRLLLSGIGVSFLFPKWRGGPRVGQQASFLRKPTACAAWCSSARATNDRSSFEREASDS